MDRLRVHEQSTVAPSQSDTAEQPTLVPKTPISPIEEQPTPAVVEPVLEARPFGDYELLGELARGGMGIVYRARERRSGRLVALKMMLDDCSLDPSQIQRFSLEARATSELNHEGIVAIHAWGEHEHRFFYTMDYVPGSPLNHVLNRKPLPTAQAVRTMLGIARAVQAAHAQGIVHRDLKPSNIMIDPTGQPRVLDFGLAKRRSPSTLHPVEAHAEDVLDALAPDAPVTTGQQTEIQHLSPQQTGKGAVLGTPGYMAPEQARGDQNQVGSRADVHALGAIFFEMLTGRPPFEAFTAMDTLIQVMEQNAPDARTLNGRVPATLAAFCKRCLAKDPQARYPDAGAFAEDLEDRWQRNVQGRRFARLAVCAWLTTLVLFGIHLLVPQSVSFWSGGFSERIQAMAETGGQSAQDGAAVLGWLLGFVIAMLPYLGLAASVTWSGAWLWSFAWHPRRLGRGDSSSAEAEPYLQKLFAVREATAAEPARGEVSMALADIEFGKSLFESPDCLLRKGRQKSLDRPVLVWMEPHPPQEGTPAPGVVVHHPSVLSLHAVAPTPEGCFLVTEPAAATPLAELLDHRRLEPLEAVFLLIKVASALQAFHDQGVVHGRVGPDWILAQGDLEPLLCPCGVPSQSRQDRQKDVMRLADLLLGWLPPRPRRWRRQPLIDVYCVCDAARIGSYARPGDLAADLERATYAALARRRARLADWVILALFVSPMLYVLFALGINTLIKSADGRPVGTGGVKFAEEFFLVLMAPSAVFLGFVHGRTASNYGRLRLSDAVPNGLWRATFLPALLRIGLIVLLPACVALCLLVYQGLRASPSAFLWAGGELLGYWFLGVCLTGIVGFMEFLVRSLRTGMEARFLESIGVPDLVGSSLPSPQEAARTFGRRSLSRPTGAGSRRVDPS